MKQALSRRGLALGLISLPLAGPHVAADTSERADYRKLLLDAYAEDRAMRPVYGHIAGHSVEEDACCLVMQRVWDVCSEIGKLPMPRTSEGLGLAALATALMWEGEEPTDSMDNLVIQLIRATLSLTGTVPPNGFIGFGDDPDCLKRDRALHIGDGVIPAWAMAEAEAARCA